MKKLAAVIFLLFLPLTASAWTADVISVIDGDSIMVGSPEFGKVEIRLYGIDAPEYDQPFGRAARRYLASLAAGSTVTVEAVTKDSYGRTVAIVRREGDSLNEKMVGVGFAWVYRSYCRKSFCRDWLGLEEEAKRKGKGLWRNSSPIPPWEWWSTFPWSGRPTEATRSSTWR